MNKILTTLLLSASVAFLVQTENIGNPDIQTKEAINKTELLIDSSLMLIQYRLP